MFRFLPTLFTILLFSLLNNTTKNNLLLFSDETKLLSNEISISVKGISDNKNDGYQKDRQEAIMDAKRQACLKAGVSIKSTSTTENFITTYDYIESKSDAILLPGFNIMDIGYVDNGTYNVVLVGKIKTSIGSEESKTSKMNQKFRAEEGSLLNIIIWVNEGKKGNETITKDDYSDHTFLLDKLYDFLSRAKGITTIDKIDLTELEDSLNEIKISKEADKYGYRFISFIYIFEAGKKFNYVQKTPNIDGTYSNYDFKKRFRKNKKYILEVGGTNAIYFNRIKEYKKEITKSRNFDNFPGDFKIVYKR